MSDGKGKHNEAKKKVLRKPPASRQSSRFKDLEAKMLEIVGDNYWQWLEEKYQETIVDHAIGYQK